MKKLFVSIMTLSIFSLSVLPSFSNEAQFHGALIGAGSGAAIGHAIGKSPEAAIIGSAVGSAIGIAIASHHGIPLPPPPPFIVPPPFPPHGKIRYERPKSPKRYHEPNIRYQPRCKIKEYREYRHGHPVTVTKRICRDDRGYRDRNYYNRGHYERDYGHIDRPWERKGRF